MAGRDDTEPPDLLGTSREARVIPQMGGVPETKEEIQRRRLIRTITVVVILVLLVIATFIGLAVRRAMAIRDAAHRASDDGRAASVQEALDLLEGEDDDVDYLALRARLHAMRCLEQGADEADRVTELLGRIPPDARPMNAVVAATYMALRAGDLNAAQSEAANITVGGTYADESARARALTAVALGNPDAALAEAQLAVDQRPGAPRHVSLLALIHSRRGEHAEALETLDTATDGESSPLVRVTRARILFEAGEDPERAVAEAEAVLGNLSGSALPFETAWARLIRGWAKATTGDSQAALQDARAAAETSPPADEMFAVALAETYLKAHAVEDASAALDLVAARTAHIRGRQAQVRAEIALERGDEAAAQQSLDQALPGTRTDLIRARLLDRRNEHAEARQLYESCAAVPAFFVEASSRLAALDLAENHAREAAARLESVLERSPAHPLAVPTAVRAKIALGDKEAAMRIATRALESHPEDPDLLAARADVELANGDDQAALRSLRAAIERRADDPRLHVLRGQAARRVGEIAEARAAFDAALEHAPTNRDALLGALELANQEGDPDRGAQLLELIDSAHVEGQDVDYALARYLIVSGQGQRGYQRVRRALVRNPRDVVLETDLGELFMQAEEWRSAANTFSTARDRSEDAAEAILGRTVAQLRLGVTVQASEGIQQAREIGARLGLGDAFEARVLAAEGRLALLAARIPLAEAKGREAVRRDERCGEAHLLLADVAQERETSAIAELRAAATARVRIPEAMGRVFLTEQDAPDACDMARGYLHAAPGGRFADRIRDLARRCPR